MLVFDAVRRPAKDPTEMADIMQVIMATCAASEIVLQSFKKEEARLKRVHRRRICWR